MLEKSYIDKVRAVRMEDEIARRGIKLRGGVDRCGPCPVCGGTDRFSINTKERLWNCRKCDRGGDVIDLVRHLDGLDFKEAVAALAGHAPPQKPALSSQSEPVELKEAASEPPSDEPKHKCALVIWAETQGPRRTLVDVYLQSSRHLESLDEAAFEAIRFHPACPFGSDRFPAMVCLVRNIVTNEPQGIHRTALRSDGTAIKRNGKTFRMSLRPIAGGVIKLDPDEDVTQGLCIGEGVETCLAGRQMGLRPVWSAVSISGVANFPVLPGIDGLHIFRENDTGGASAKATETCARRWYEAGRDVVIVDPDIGGDLNDELREAAR